MAVREGRRPTEERRLRYFTFPADTAVDVLMLDVAKVVRVSTRGRFDKVYFFNESDESVGRTTTSIPGAIGFAGDFVDVVMVDDPSESDALSADPDLGMPPEIADTRQNRARLLRERTHRDFVKAFPFDVMNLDLESHLFKQSESIPGQLIRALRRVFEYQKRPLIESGKSERLEAFTLMFTTRVGPPNMGESFLSMLRETLSQNMTDAPTLRLLLKHRVGFDDVKRLQDEKFEEFFKLAVPKMLARLLMDTDWYIDPEDGIVVYEFERTPEGVESYRMLHFVMQVRRHEPRAEYRAPGSASETAWAAYREVVRRVFERRETVVRTDTIDEAALEADLAKIDARRRKYRFGA